VSCSFSFAQGRSAAIEHKLMVLGNTQPPAKKPRKTLRPATMLFPKVEIPLVTGPVSSVLALTFINSVRMGLNYILKPREIKTEIQN
jgi:hypothetical protein